MKKFFLLTAVSLLAGVLSGCGGGGDTPIETHDVKYVVKTAGQAVHLPDGTTSVGYVTASVKYRIRNQDGSVADVSGETRDGTFEYSMKAEAGQSLMVTASTVSPQFLPPVATIMVDGEVWKQVYTPSGQTVVTVEANCCSK